MLRKKITSMGQCNRTEFETKSGRKVQILSVKGPGDYPIVGAMADERSSPKLGYSRLGRWDQMGKSYLSKPSFDLVESEKTFHQNIYWSSERGRPYGGKFYDTEQEARMARSGSDGFFLEQRTIRTRGPR